MDKNVGSSNPVEKEVKKKILEISVFWREITGTEISEKCKTRGTRKSTPNEINNLPQRTK